MDSLSIEQGTRCLFWLQNENGGWGIEKAVGSRVTNTAEAIWALTSVGANGPRISDAVEFLYRAVEGSNKGREQNCQHAREYAWTLFALSSYGLQLDESHVVQCTQWLIDEANRAEEGWGPRSLSAARQSDATQYTAMATAALQLVLQNNPEFEDKSLLDRIRTRMKEGLMSLAHLRNQDGGWGEALQDLSHPAFTAYALFAMKCCRGMRPNEVHITQARDFILGSATNDATATTKQDLGGGYRHFTRAWSLLALVTNPPDVQLEEVYRLGYWLVDKQNTEGNDTGWSGIDDSGASTTWGTADALVALHTFSRSLCLEDVLSSSIKCWNRIEELDTEIREQRDKQRKTTELSFVWYFHDRAICAANDWIVSSGFLVYILFAAVLMTWPPFSLRREWLIIGMPLGIVFFAYSYWKKRQTESTKSSVVFAVAIISLIYTLIFGIYSLFG